MAASSELERIAVPDVRRSYDAVESRAAFTADTADAVKSLSAVLSVSGQWEAVWCGVALVDM